MSGYRIRLLYSETKYIFLFYCKPHKPSCKKQSCKDAREARRLLAACALSLFLTLASHPSSDNPSPMASWSSRELAALFQAWRESTDTPLSERSKLSIEVFRRFSELVGDASLRSEAALAFKQGSLRNMTQLLLAFGDHDKWFGLSLDQKKRWFKMVNRMSYRFVDLDRETFDAVADLIEGQADFAGSDLAGSGAETTSGLRVRLRRNSIDGEWEAQPGPEMLESDEVLKSSNPLRPSRLPLQLPSALQKRSSHAASTRPVKQFPFPSARGDTRSIFAPVSTNGSRSIFAPASANGSRSIFAPASTSSSSIFEVSATRSGVTAEATEQGHDRHPTSQRGGARVVLAVNSSDSASSAESSDGDDGMQEESRAVAVHLKQLERESSGSSTVSTALPTKRTPTQKPLVIVGKQRVAGPLPAASHAATKKRRCSTLRAATHSPSTSPKDDLESRDAAPDENPELMLIANVLEKQARELKLLLAVAKEERALDLQQRERDVSAKQTRDAEIRSIMDVIKLGRTVETDTQLQEEKRLLVDEIERLREERRAFEQECEAETEIRRQVLAQIALDREERREFEAARERDRADREEYLACLERDREERKHARETRELLATRISRLLRERQLEVGTDGDGVGKNYASSSEDDSSRSRCWGDGSCHAAETTLIDRTNMSEQENTTPKARERFPVGETPRALR